MEPHIDWEVPFDNEDAADDDVRRDRHHKVRRRIVGAVMVQLGPAFGACDVDFEIAIVERSVAA